MSGDLTVDVAAPDPLAEVADPATAPALRWGIVGPGGIARKFVAAVHGHTAGSVVAVASRHPGRAADFAGQHGIPRGYGGPDGYAALAADPDVDVVYVASPHSAHREHAVAMLQAGKPVLVEKALARNGGEVEDIFAAAEAAGVFAMEAMWTRHLPHMVVVRRWLTQGRVGQPISVSADHGQFLDFAADHRVKAPELAGGALLDLGVYPVAFILDVLGAPTAVHASGQLAETGVDASVAITMSYPDPVVAQACCTLKAKTPTVAVIAGTAGRIEIDGDFYAPTTVRLIDREGGVLTVDGRVDNGFQFQIAEVARCLADGRRQSPVMSWDHSRAVIAVLDEARRQVGVRYPGE